MDFKIKLILYRGYNFPYPTEVLIEGKSYQIKHIKTGNIIEITNLTDFCRKNKIGDKAMNSMLMGKQLQSRGYCLPEVEILSVKKTLAPCYWRMF